MTQTQDQIYFHFDTAFQEGMFSLMVNDADFAYKCVHSLKPQYFANQYYAKIFEIICRLMKDMPAGPTPMMLYNELLKFKEEEKPPYLVIFKKILDPQQPRNYDYIRKQLENFVKRSSVWQFHKKLIDSKAQDPDTLFQMTMKEMEAIQNITFQSDDTLTLSNISTFLERHAAKSGQLFPIGMPTIDSALGGGIPRGTLTTAIGGTNVGKSIFLHNLASEWLQRGYRVMVVNLEGVAAQPMLRILSRSMNIPYSALRFNNLEEFQRKRIKKFEDQFVDSLQIKHVEDFNYSVEDLYAYARDKKQKWPFDALLVDYGQIMTTKTKQEGLRHTQAYVHRGLASIAAALDCAVVTVAQGTRDTQEKNQKGNSLLRMNDVSECFEICRVSAQVLTINRSEIDEQRERCRILLDKQRDGRKGVVEICKTNFNTASLYGSAEQGLGFISAEQYISEEMMSMETVGQVPKAEAVQ